MSTISQVFKKLRKTGKKALIPYLMAGSPSLDDTKRFIQELEEAGADIIELGVPFSDPLADGPAIQRQYSAIPLILMTYYNPVFRYGLEAFARDASAAGVNGIIVPDLIPDEAKEFMSSAKKYHIDTIFLLAPTSTEERINKVVKASSGFIYYVSVTGITGAQLLVDNTMKDTLSMIKSVSGKPVCVGFGISTPDEASAVSKLADGVIVGSAIVKLIQQGKDIRPFVKSLRQAI
jgi:tryptophan synthase alpha chain